MKIDEHIFVFSNEQNYRDAKEMLAFNRCHHYYDDQRWTITVRFEDISPVDKMQLTTLCDRVEDKRTWRY